MENLDKSKVIKVDSEGITFDSGIFLYSDHSQDCCEWHELTFSDLTIDDFKDLEFDLTKDDFFTKIEDFGIELNPIKGFSVKIPGHGSNNGYYGTNIDLVLRSIKDNKIYKEFDVSECQIIND